MQRRRPTTLSLAVALVVTCWGWSGYAGATLATNATTSGQQIGTPSANDAASAMVDALAAAEAPAAGAQVPPIPENHSYDRAQRIVARKGVSSEAVGARNGTNSPNPTEDVVAAVAPPPALLAKATDVANGTARSATNSSSSSVGSTSVSSTTIAGAKSSSTSVPSSTGSHPVTVSSQMPHNDNKPSVQTPSTGMTITNVTVMTTSSKPIVSSSSSTTTTTTTTVKAPATSPTTSTASTTTTTTLGTTVAPRKPKVVYSVEDEPRLVQAAKPGYSLPAPVPFDEPLDGAGRLRVDEPLAQLSKEYIAPGAGPNRRDYVLPIVTLIFVVPLLLGLFLLSYRRAKEFWLTRHYRRMDFLIDGMYNY
uniref:Uncharacterized protein n=2 Tax=Anopheles albimanus TaxID=7167 RepID=A0A182FJC0_ANOAL